MRAVGTWQTLLTGLGIIVLGAGSTSAEDARERGRALFLREWQPNDERGRGGDGLGPFFNASSCVACHERGGPGGAGTNDVNVELAILQGKLPNPDANRKPERIAQQPLVKDARRSRVNPEPLFKFVPGFRDARSLVLPRFSTDPAYAQWRKAVLGFEVESPDGSAKVSVRREERNTPALFGMGLLDAIPDDVLLLAAQQRFEAFPEVQGRVARLDDGRIGRFGWKGQMASLSDFVLTACAVEVGLEVPGHRQGADPRTLRGDAPGLDLSREDCEALIAYVRALPPPAFRQPRQPREIEAVANGRALFETIGCATCHRPSLGQVEGLYSDLSLHDMGDAAMSFGFGYGGGGGTPHFSTSGNPGAVARESLREATPTEWRTPPLWGLRDSGPYLHDGRARTIDEVIHWHGGEAAKSALRYVRLRPKQRAAVVAFLGSLRAPANEVTTAGRRLASRAR